MKAKAAKILALRHEIHQHPELSNREENTARLVSEYLQKLGIEVKMGVAHHGVIGLLKGGRAGPTIAVRADMDALPVTEDTPLSFRSTVRAHYLGQPAPQRYPSGGHAHRHSPFLQPRRSEHH